MGKKRKKSNVKEMEIMEDLQPEITVEEGTKKDVKYVVVREGHRVSDKEYDSATDPVCIEEVNFWTKVAKNHSYGEKVEVVPYDSKKHRVW
ncbi:MAG TPA: hypothetical protein PKX15_06885 [Bacteroidales bacterium]|nr:hypothetical protein [Bacteroidales bacterium]